jgi:hypothetical protein
VVLFADLIADNATGRSTGCSTQYATTHHAACDTANDCTCGRAFFAGRHACASGEGHQRQNGNSGGKSLVCSFHGVTFGKHQVDLMHPVSGVAPFLPSRQGRNVA